MISFQSFLFSLVDIEEGNVFQKNNMKNLLPFSLGGRKCGREIGLRCGQRCKRKLFLDRF
jgi:hypothetical protein